LLDEPTNDLDVNTLRALEEAILNFAGTTMVISHDRWFLNRVATHILAFEGDSKEVIKELSKGSDKFEKLINKLQTARSSMNSILEIESTIKEEVKK